MRSGRKSEAQTPSPKKDQIKGSKVNPKGSASSAKSAKSIELSDSITTTLENKRDEYNKKHPNGKVTLGALKAVFRRGAGAFSSSHRPGMSRSGWAFARVNKFLLKKGGTKVKAAYVQDDDLMERGAILDSIDPYGQLKSLIEEGVVDLKFYETTPEHAKEYGIQANKPLYVQNLIVIDKERLKGIGKKFLHHLDNYANENGNDVIFGYLADKSSFSRDSRQSIYSDIDMIKNWLHNNGYAINNETNEFHKVVKPNIKYEGGGNLGQEITCVNCGWHWNTNQSDAFDKYICHRCGFDNRTFYDSDPIGEYHLGGDMSMHLAPNGKPSNLTHEQWHLVRTPEFKAWFGDWERLALLKIKDSGVDEVTLDNIAKDVSKVVDENGEPLVVYRGDSSKTDTFGENTFFSSNDYVAGSYSNEAAVPEYEVFLNIKKPLDLLGGNELRRNPNSSRLSGSDPNVVSIFKEAISQLPNDYTVKVGWGDVWDKQTLYDAVINNFYGIEYINYDNQSASWDAIIKYAKDNGFDGVFMLDESVDRLIRNQFSQIAFNSNQIKLADGTNTTFDGENPDIRYEDGGIIDETYNKVLQGSINSDDGAIFLDENGIEVTDEIYDLLRNAEAESVKKSRGLQVGDIITVKGKNGNDDFKGNFRGYTQEGKLIVVYDGGNQTAISKDEYYAEGLHEKDIKNELLLGIEREMEHTDDPRYAKAIALDHLYENPKYYTKLKEMEKSFKKGGYFSDRYPKNEYIQLSNEDIDDFKEDIFNIINSSYAYIGGHIEFQKPDDIVNSDLNFWIGADIDEDPEVDTIIGGKKTNFGTKLTASAQDGSRNAKISVMKKMAELLNTKGFYAETNLDLALKRGTDWEKDENIIRKVVGKSDIVMNEDGSYTRSIGGHPHRKVLVGYFDHLKEKNYKRGGELNPDNKGVKDYFAGGSGSTGGVLVGKRHSEGGIKAINKATNTPLEMEGGEVVITRNAVSDNKKREFEGQMLTNKEILSKINVSGGGVSLYEDGGKVGCSFCTGKKYKYGGEMVSDYQIYDEVMRSGGDLALNNKYNTMSYQDSNDVDDYNYDEQEIIYHFLRTDADYVYIDRDNVQNIKGLINKGLFNYRETNGNYNVEVYPTKMGKKLLSEMPVEAFKEGGNLPNRKKIIIDTNDGRSKRKKLEDYYASIQEDKQFASGGIIDGLEDLSNCSRSFLVDIKNSGLDYLDYSADRKNEVKELVDNDLIYFTDSSLFGCVTAFLTKKGKQFISSVPTHLFKKGGMNDCGCGCGSYKDGGETDADNKYFKGVTYDYENQFLVNKAIEELLNMKDSKDMTIDEKNFITYYSGYGGLEKYGASGKGLLYEYFTPSLIAKKMWGLAYKHGFEGGFVLEPSCGIGEFIKYAPEQEMVQGYEINETSAKICKILYPKSNIKVEPFEKMFIKNNYTIKGQINGMNKYSLVIGNPPYGSMGGLYAGMGEKDYAKANNYIDYFILRGLDLLQSGGLLVFIIGVEVAAGGTPYLEQGVTENKKLVSKIADLVDAYRLPNGVFERTDVLTDIVVFKKK